ncbi:MAG TPA: helicase-associated domain-containing protein [Streptosporangiaceae bacterium]
METFADWVRARSDEELRALLAERPELITPVPADLNALAARAATPSAVVRGLDRLDRFALAAIEGLLVLPQPVSYDRLAAALAPAAAVPGSTGGSGSATDADAQVRIAIDRLTTLGLAWEAEDGLRTAPGVRQALQYPAGLGPPAREAFAGYSPERLGNLAADLGVAPDTAFPAAETLLDAISARLADPGDLIDDAGGEAGAALDHLTWGPPVGRVEGARRPVRIATAATPIERLLARGLLAATDERAVVLPREVALHLRAGRLFRDPVGGPPPLDGAVRDRTVVDRTAGGEAFTFVRTVEDLLERWGVRPPPVLRSGGLAVRDLRTTAAELDVPEWTAALLLEVANAAGLLARHGGEWLPTRTFDLWRLRDVATRWTELAGAWLDTDRVPGLAGGRDERDKTINALADESVRTSAAAVRRAVLEALAATRKAPDLDAVRAYLAWREPRRGGRLRDHMIEWALREAEVLGLTGRGALARHARALLADRSEGPGGGGAAARLADVLPEPVDHVLIQADLTAVAPGPLTAELARELGLMADVESTGGATVYRFGPDSIRRALDAGRSAAEVLDVLQRHSRTPVPQPLTYLVEDIARKHGHLRVGIASSYVRCDDPATLDEILASREAPGLRLHRLAPTVVATRLTRSELLESLRAMGFAPVAESPEGGVVITRPDARRAEPSTRLRAIGWSAAPDDAVVTAAIRALRAGDEAARHSTEFARLRLAAPDGEPPRTPSMATVEELRAAVERGGRVWIGYLDQQGQASSRIVEPVRVDGGFLTAYDATRATVQRFALHRITGVAKVDSRASS